jgi:hypothetical protein
MAEALYRKCPLCEGTLEIRDLETVHEGLPPKPCPCRGSKTPGWAEVGLTVGQVDKVIADRLRTALEHCDVVMDTAAIHGLPQQLPEVYRDSWARTHIEARAALAATGG